MNPGSFLFYMVSEQLPESEMEQMGGCMVSHGSEPDSAIDNGLHRLIRMLGQALAIMDDQIILLLYIDHPDGCMIRFNISGIAYLSTTLSVKGSLIKNQMKQDLVFTVDLPVLENPNFLFQLIVPGKAI